MIIVLLLIMFTLGFLYGALRYQKIPEIAFPDREVFLDGIVIDVPEKSGAKGRFTVDDVVIEGRHIQGRIRLSVLPELFASKGIPAPVLPSYADRISAVARLKEPSVFRNPGVYSYDLRKDGIIAIGYVKELHVSGKEERFLAWIQKKRQTLGNIIDRSLVAENASLHRAIVPGLKKGIAQEMRDAFSASGVAHLLSISGTHFGLLAFMLFQAIKIMVKLLPEQLLKRITIYTTPTQMAAVLTLPVLVMYALISGASTPTIRSLIMIFIYLLALFLGRRDQWLNSLSIAAVIILLWQPKALFEVSFQLSFLAVLFIGLVLEKRAEHEKEYTVPDDTALNSARRTFIHKISERVRTAVLITIAAVFGTAPFVAVYFKQFPLIAPLTNLIITPLVCFIILPLGLFTGFAALLLNMSTLPFNLLTDSITSFALHLIRFFSHIPYANFHIHNPSFLTILFYFFSLAFFLKSRWKWRFLPLILTICLYLLSPSLYKEDNLTITFLDVGQGESSVVVLPDKKVMIIDGGIDEPDMGRMVVAPYLWSQDIKKIDFMVVSHPHADHFGGLIYIADTFNVKEIWTNGRMNTDAENFFSRIEKKNIPLKILKRGDLFESRDYKVYTLHPYDDFYAGSSRGEFSNQNSDSLVMKIQSNGFSALFTGDIEAEAEQDLVHLGHWLKSDVMKVPHHGSKTSSTSAFIQTVRPRIAVISVGRNNPFNLPNDETLRHYSDVGARLLRTDLDGAVRIIFRDQPHPSYEVKTYQDFTFKAVQGLKDELRNLRLLL
jgi:competence protein ComEC